MLKKELYITDFCDLFHHAEKHFGISWNEANALFFRSEYIPYKGHHLINVEEWLDTYEECLDDWDKANFITRHFFQANNVPEFEEVLMDCG